jgi:hypothetical protein
MHSNRLASSPLFVSLFLGRSVSAYFASSRVTNPTSDSLYILHSFLPLAIIPDLGFSDSHFVL